MAHRGPIGVTEREPHLEPEHKPEQQSVRIAVGRAHGQPERVAVDVAKHLAQCKPELESVVKPEREPNGLAQRAAVYEPERVSLAFAQRQSKSEPIIVADRKSIGVAQRESHHEPYDTRKLLRASSLCYLGE